MVDDDPEHRSTEPEAELQRAHFRDAFDEVRRCPDCDADLSGNELQLSLCDEHHPEIATLFETDERGQ